MAVAKFSLALFTILLSAIQIGINLIHVVFSDQENDSNSDLDFGTHLQMFICGGILGGFLSGFLAQLIGRKGTLLANTLTSFISIGLQFSAVNDLPTLIGIGDSKILLAAGQFVLGFNTAINLAIAPLYLTEISQTSSRGAIGTSFPLIAILTLSITLFLKLEVYINWSIYQDHLKLFVIILPSLFQFLLLLFCPESPRHIYFKSVNKSKTERALTWLRGDKNQNRIDNELSQIFAEYQFIIANRSRTRICEFCIAALITCILYFGITFSGIHLVIEHSIEVCLKGETTYTFEPSNPICPIYGFSLLGLILFSGLVSMILIDKAGRRFLLLLTFPGMLLSMVAMWLFMYFFDKPSVNYSVTMVPIYVMFFSLGPGSILWYLPAELFQQKQKMVGISFASLAFWFGCGLNYVSLPFLKEMVGDYVHFMYTIVLAILFIFTCLLLPETKKKTIDEVEFGCKCCNSTGKKQSNSGSSKRT